MRRCKRVVSHAFDTLRRNIRKTGDPLGLRHPYWTGWTKKGAPCGPEAPAPQASPSAESGGQMESGGTPPSFSPGDSARAHAGRRSDRPAPLLLTGRMYQMLPYVVEATKMMQSAAPLLGTRGVASLIGAGGRIAGGPVIRWKAERDGGLAARAGRILQGIDAALRASGIDPSGLGEAEPYCGTLLYDLGFEEDFLAHGHKVCADLKARNITRIITVDPHTAHIMKTVYPASFPDFGARVTHYLEDLDFARIPKPAEDRGLPSEMAVHDSCVMSRQLGIAGRTRLLCERLGIRLLEPENTGLDTACCGGPIEYAFSDLCGRVSRARIEELKSVCPNILVACPICLINLGGRGDGAGSGVWDAGELLYRAYCG